MNGEMESTWSSEHFIFIFYFIMLLLMMMLASVLVGTHAMNFESLPPQGDMQVVQGW